MDRQTTGIILAMSYFFSSTEIGDFQKIVGTFIEMVDIVAKEVEQEKMKVTSLELKLALEVFPFTGGVLVCPFLFL